MHSVLLQRVVQAAAAVRVEAAVGQGPLARATTVATRGVGRVLAMQVLDPLLEAAGRAALVATRRIRAAFVPLVLAVPMEPTTMPTGPLAALVLVNGLAEAVAVQAVPQLQPQVVEAAVATAVLAAVAQAVRVLPIRAAVAEAVPLLLAARVVLGR